MTGHAQRIGPQQPSTPGSRTPGGQSRAIPPDLLRDASKRLEIMSLTACVLWVVGTVLWHLTWPSFHPGRPSPGFRSPDAVVTISALCSLGFYFYIRRQKQSPEITLRIGLGYMILTCLAVALMMHIGLPHSEPLDPQISWNGVVVLMFAATVPIAPRHMVVASLVGVSMAPLAMMFTRVHGLAPLAALERGVLMHYSDFLVAGVAIVVSRVVTRLGHQVSKAREMGAYQLGDLIKRGGMGEIYKATHRMLARPAAIKLIRPEMLAGAEESGELAIIRFRREAEAAANLRCPHTVELFDFGVTEDNTLYFVMELLEGMDLETLVRQHGPLPPARVIHILRQACESLEEAHLQGLIHRDIKPANIHLGRVGARHDFVKVLDFGLVKSVKSDRKGDSLATAVGLTPGTPAYMAPEMAVGEQIDGRADIYALGCVAYYLLTGRLVFDAENTFQMVAKHLRNQPVPPSLRAGVDVPRPLEELILACLEKNPAARPASVAQLARSLGSIRAGTWSDDEAEAWWKKREPVSPEASLPANREQPGEQAEPVLI
ncbi:MAG TPA: serine/threonine-protein kinase [Gemmatimonadaceae bacterium]|nr:serine/threonine-protein kinase [Gemmatimonadaceae bacterium]